MRAGGLGGLLTLFTALFLRNPTSVRSSDPPPLYNVTVMCDNYGVVVSWESSSHQQQFNLKLKSDFGDVMKNITRKTHYNISEHLLDTAYNVYLVNVQTEDGKFADSKSFTYNRFKDNGKQCNLTFPPVELVPGDYQLTVKFRNPFHLYRDTPALRKLQENDNLEFTICTTQTDHSDDSQDSCMEHSFTCTQKSDTCEGTVPFPEKQDEYCVTVFGSIRQTYVQKTERICYRGSLKPSLPITVYIVPACVVLGIALIIGFMMFLAKKINKNIKEKIRSNLPDFLVETSYTHPFSTLIPGPEPVERNPLVEPVILIPINLDPPANSSQPGNTLVVCVREAEVVVEAEEREDEAIDGGMEAGYDMPHGPLLERRVELSPGDIVTAYKG